MSKILLAAVAALSLTAAASPVLAADAKVQAQAVSTAKVDYRDQAAVQRLYGQLARAAAKVCDSNSANPVVAQDDRACANAALAKAVRDIAQPTLTAQYEAKHGADYSRYAAR